VKNKYGLRNRVMAITLLGMVGLIGLLSACGGGGGAPATATGTTLSHNVWTWMSGSNVVGQKGVYGTQGTAAAGNIPGARQNAVTWIDASGNRWLFGGHGYDSAGTVGKLNDLWKFDGTNWTWVSGSNLVNQKGTYGALGVAAAGNIPGARGYAISWTDGARNLWLFSGNGYDSAGTLGVLNDLWKFDGANWTWVAGGNLVNQKGTYGTLGVAAAGNIPGARNGSIGLIDGSGILWLFGGLGYDSAGAAGNLNDLWKFDGTNWTWVSGSNVVNQTGVYGTQGTAAAGNIPGARNSAISWVDGSGKFWLFGGQGYDSAGTLGFINDLWKFDGTNWIWVSGSNLINQMGTYGTQGVAAAGNVPGARLFASSWIDGSGNRWLFGGQGYDSAGTLGYLNDLWKFDGTNWAWVSGSNVVNQKGTYGTQGMVAAGNMPGARWNAIRWIDASGNLWLFGGLSYDSAGTYGITSDLWRYQP